MKKKYFIITVLLLLGLFFIPGGETAACEMHEKAAEKTAAHQHKNESSQKQAEEKMECCTDMATDHHSNGHCDHKDCTNNICHPVSIFSLHTENNISLLPLPKAVTNYIVGKYEMQLFSYSYSIWQPPRLG